MISLQKVSYEVSFVQKDQTHLVLGQPDQSEREVLESIYRIMKPPRYLNIRVNLDEKD